MRIAIIGSRGFPYVYSGYETLVTHLAPGLAERGHDVLVYCHRSLFLHRPTGVDGVQLVYVPGVSTKSLSQITHSLAATLDVLFRRVDVVLYVNAANGPFGPVLRLFRKRCAINVDGLEWQRPKWKGIGGLYFRWASKIAARSFREVVTDADAMADVYEAEFGRASTTIEYGAVLDYPEEPELLAPLGLIPHDYFLVVGRLVPDNNADLIVRAFTEAKTSRQLVVVGDVPYRDSFADRVRSVEDGRVRFLGYIRDQTLLKELYCNCHAYVHGHEFGGTNPTLLQALASGACILALDTPFNREVLDGERYGIFFRKDVAELSAAISRVDGDSDLVRTMRERARGRIDGRYTWSIIVDKYESLFRGMMNGLPCT